MLKNVRTNLGKLNSSVAEVALSQLKYACMRVIKNKCETDYILGKKKKTELREKFYHLKDYTSGNN